MPVMAIVLRHVASGEMTPQEGEAVARLVETYVRSVEALDIDRRLRALEEREAK
jgi:hypothetical protein